MPHRKHSKPGRRRVAGDGVKVGRTTQKRRTSIEFRPPPSGGGHVTLYPPYLVSAVPTRDYTISLTWFYRREDISEFQFQRTNLTLLTTDSFVVTDPTRVPNPPGYQGGRTWAFDDTELDPQTSYRYRVGAIHPPGDPEWSGVYGDPNEQITATTLNTQFGPTFENTLRYDEEAWEGWCLVQRIEPHGLSRTGKQVVLTLRASSANQYGAFIERVYISKADPAGYPYTPAGDLAEVNPKFDIPAGQTVTLPPVRYKLDKEQPLLIAFDFKIPPWPSGIAYRPVKSFGPLGRPIVPVGVAYWYEGEEAARSDRSANYGSANRIYLIEKIEVR